MEFKKGTRVCFCDSDHSWILGNVVSYTKSGKKEVIMCKADDFPGKEFTVNTSLKLYLAQDDLFKEEPDDLLMLTELHEATLLSCLKKRFLKDVVYTNIGTLVVAINPFKRIPCYQPENTIQNYLAEGPVVQGQLPHCWSVAHQTYFELVNDRQNQTILISGESGAGKTVAAKIVVEYLTAVSCQKATAETKHATEQVGIKVQAASPVLESFGNAKTVRNDNSSRFGKFMKIQFDCDGFLIGAHTTKYLLEKSRIITAAENERIYHIFYQICAHGDHAKYDLADAGSYVSCNAGKCLTIDGVNDDEDQQACIDALHSIGTSEEDIESVWRTVAGIMHLQNTTLSEKNDNNMQVAYLTPDSLATLKQACAQLCIDEAAMEKELTSTTMSGKISTTIKLTRAKALDVRDSFCRRVYDGMFQWLVDKINLTTDVGDKCENWLGLLDIFGFECFEFNSFEQLCINLANEALQNHYNSYIFVEDMKECEREGIDVTGVDFADNQECLDLLTSKNSIFSTLDVECKLGSGTDLSLLEKLHESFGPKGKLPGHDFYGQPRGETLKKNPNSFIVHHYAGNVIYNVQGWLEKNKEPLKDEMKRICNASTNKLIGTFLPPPVDTRGSATPTVSGFFKEQVGELIQLVNSTNPHWIRCVKPHPAKKPLLWDPCQVMNQLRSAGVIETVRVRKAGYPIRFKHRLFRERYCALLGSEGLNASNLEDPSENKSCSTKILSTLNLGKDIAQMGTSLVFLRQAAFIQLNTAKDAATAKYIKIVQKLQRARKGRHEAFLLYVEKHKARLEQEGKDKIEAELQAAEAARQRERDEVARRLREEEEHREVRQASIIIIQRNVRGFLARTKVLRRMIEAHRAAQEARHDASLFEQRIVFSELESQRLSVEAAEERLSQRLKPVSVKQIQREAQKEFKEKQDQRRQDYDDKLSQSRRLREERVLREEEVRRQRVRKNADKNKQTVLSGEVEKRAREKFLKQQEKKGGMGGTTLTPQERADHFRKACLDFEARDDWEHNREEYLSHDHTRRMQQERLMRSKQYLVDHDLYTNPPNTLCPDLSLDHGVPSTLTHKQRALESSYQQKVQREYSLLCSLGKGMGEKSGEKMEREKWKVANRTIFFFLKESGELYNGGDTTEATLQIYQKKK